MYNFLLLPEFSMSATGCILILRASTTKRKLISIGSRVLHHFVCWHVKCMVKVSFHMYCIAMHINLQTNKHLYGVRTFNNLVSFKTLKI